MGLMVINRFNHLAQCLSLLNPLPQCISSACPCLHICSLNLMCFSCQFDEPYGFSGDHLQNAAMLQCVSRYLQRISVTVSLLYSIGNKTYSYCYCYYWYYVYDRGCWHMYIDTTPGSVPSKASSSSCLLTEGKTLLIWLAWTGLQFCTDLCHSDRCWGKCNLVIPMTFYTS